MWLYLLSLSPGYMQRNMYSLLQLNLLHFFFQILECGYLFVRGVEGGGRRWEGVISPPLELHRLLSVCASETGIVSSWQSWCQHVSTGAHACAWAHMHTCTHILYFTRKWLWCAWVGSDITVFDCFNLLLVGYQGSWLKRRSAWRGNMFFLELTWIST